MKSNTIWVLLSGLAVGVLIGREWGRSEHPSASDDKAAQQAKADQPTQAGPIPTDWLTETDLKVADKFAGLTPAQRYLALKIINATPCDCGCPHGSFAKCAKEDPGCPRAPGVIAQVASLVKDGKSESDIKSAIAKPANAQRPPEQTAQKVELAKWTPVRGPKHAKVTILEFSDFQWPFCGRVGPTLKKIEDTYGKDVRIAFRNQPLPFHQHAREAAEAAMAANAQGKFWEMHDKLFANQSALDRPSLEKYAQEIGLNMSKFKADMDGKKQDDQIDADSKRGNEVGANGTPMFFINGQPLSGAQPFEAFKAVIDAEIKKADDLIKKGTPLDKLYDKELEQLASAAPAAAAPPPERAVVEVGDAPIRGKRSAPVTLLEFSDFQWPFCGRVGPTLKQLEDEYKGKIRVAFKMKPLPFHQYAHLAAEAALAADEQGKFWEYHDLLFANQQALDRPSLEKYAEQLGLNMAKFRAALDSGKFKERVDREAAEGDKVGAGGTPTFFINGYKLVGAQPIDQFKKLIDQELKSKG